MSVDMDMNAINDGVLDAVALAEATRIESSYHSLPEVERSPVPYCSGSLELDRKVKGMLRRRGVPVK